MEQFALKNMLSPQFSVEWLVWRRLRRAVIPEGWGNLAGGEERQRRYPRKDRPHVPTPEGSRKSALGLDFPHPSGVPPSG
ncbi:MAG: hypothetical protein RL514_1055 [Verrucomicrobiota bacterium]|jgi:hypothetical protein